MRTDYVRAARLRTSKDFPYLQAAIWSMTLVKTDRVPTMAVDAGWRCYYNEEEMRKRQVEEVAGILVHEVWHLLRKHHKRAATLGIDHRTALEWNIATDCEINDDAIAHGAVLVDGLHPSHFGWPPDQLAETYYGLIPPPPPGDAASGENDNTSHGRGTQGVSGKDIGSQGVSGGCDQIRERAKHSQWFGGSCSDNLSRPYELPPTQEQAPAKTEGEAELIRRRVASELTAHKIRGLYPAGLQRWAEEVLAPPKINWQRELMVSARRAVSQVIGKSDYTYRRFGRRSTEQVLRPAMISFKPSVAVVVDTSGSIAKEELTTALNETRNVIKTLNAPVSVIACDAHAEISKNVFDVRSIQLIGGGGTDMGQGIRAAVALKPRPDVVITITDGFTPWPKEAPPAEHITVLTTKDGARPTFGKTICIQ